MNKQYFKEVKKNIKAYLPKSFSFKQAKDLVRIGKNNDGGYLVSLSDIKVTDTLIGMGLNDDWSFESDFVSYNDVEVLAYDASLNFRFWIKRAFIETIKNPFSLYAIKKFFSYKKFFKGKHKHIKKFVGLKTNFNNYCTFLEVLNSTRKKSIFLKIDIEGSEYRFLDSILENEDRIVGMVIEFHDCDLHLNTIVNFINKFNLKLVHIHANNFAPIKLDDGIPLVLELTFSRNAEFSNYLSLPHKFDMPNDNKFLEYELIIKN